VRWRGSDLEEAAQAAFEQGAAHLGDWLAVWAETEVLLSLSTVGLVREVYAFPELLEDASPRLEAKNLTHLLIPEEKAVPNDIGATAGTRIITGSNMSGKTTYMRTLGSNAVLAYAGAPVCAKAFALTPMAVYTFLETNDFEGKTIIPFSTSLTDALTGNEKNIPLHAKGAKVLDGLGLEGKFVHDTPRLVKPLVKEWLDNLNWKEAAKSE